MTRPVPLCRRLLAVLLALLLVLGLAPAALAAASCPQCGGDVTCTDNGDGRTHTVSCPKDGAVDQSAPHDFGDDGFCTACGTMDYTKVRIVLPDSADFTAARGDSDAALTLDHVKLTLADTDVTSEYTLSYNWYYNGSFVSTGQRCTLPSSVSGREGDYDFVCFVTAVPGNALAGKTISASCTIKVHVQELLSAEAVVSSRDLYLALGDTTGRTPVSVADQIAQAVADAGGEAAYVVFDEKPHSAAGDLKCTAGEHYVFSGEGNSLSQVRFEPDDTGAYAIGFTVYDQDGSSWPGLLTIAVEQALGSVDVVYTGEKGQALSFSTQDFQDFWHAAYPQGELTLVRFTSLPAASAGTLRQGYTSAARPGSAVEVDESLYASDSKDHVLLSTAAFVPDSRFTGPVSIPFDAYGSDGNGNQTYRSGRVFLFINPTSVEPVTVSAASGGSARFSASAFLSVYRSVTGSRGNGFYLRFLEVPASGTLFAGRTSSSAGTRLTAASIDDRVFPYSTIGSLSYTAGKAAEESVRYAAYSSAGELLYVGSADFTVAEDTKNPFTDVKDSDWFYPYVVDLAESGVISGTSPSTFSPRANVTWGEALKLVLLATGYGEQDSDGSHWASGYLSRALAAKLLTEAVPLNRSITRGELAELAAKALKLRLPTRLEETPFQDVPPASSAAGAITALYEAGIVEGSALSGGQSLYRPDEPLRRSEIAAIIWRIQQAAKKA